jgi:hypothetical protein
LVGLALLLSALLLAVASAPAYADQSGTARTAPPPPLGGVFHPIRSDRNLCLEPAGRSTAEFAVIVQQRCATTGQESLAQGWQSIKVGTNHYRFVNQLSGFCFDAFDGAHNGARLLQGTCVPISNEEFNTGTSLPASSSVKIESREGFRDTKFCVDVPGGNPTRGLAVQFFTCNGTSAQKWTIDSV